ncbi:proton-coupled amino acid transporter-like protein CG1139 [Metopolophium dirhodum]|uniref:proton-coupled amino acid transporter-like protein CG1139 n=1 Tax=Metopolophium dirhodum TaxID=44670 RepID=UPI00298F54ED|nr:proton-coupled amino acid transporter-like protein CG1139 [Metopolophium dirhodum]
MVEVQSQTGSPKPMVIRRCTEVPMAIGSPTASEMTRRRRRRSRLMSNASSVVSAAAAGIPASEKHKISNNAALMHMVKATIGGGFLAMPEAFHNIGIVMGIVGTAILGLSVLNMMSCIVRFSQILRSGKYVDIILAEQNGNKPVANGEGDGNDDSKQPSKPRHSNELVLPPMDYPDTVAAVFKYRANGRFARFAPFARNFTSASLVATYYGVNIIYVCIIASTLKQVIDQFSNDVNSWTHLFHGLSIRWYPIMCSVLIVPMGMIRLIKYLVPFSVAANACMLGGTAAVFYFILFGDDSKNPITPEEQAKWVVWPATRWTLFAGSALCSLEGVGMLLHIENAMSRPLELAGPPAYTLHRSMVVIVVMNSVLGLFGYLRYGDRCAGSISLNLPQHNILSIVIKLMIAGGILLTYGLQLTVTTDLAWQGLRSKVGKSTDGSDSDDAAKDDDSSPKMIAYYYSMRFLLILGSIMVAVAVPDIGPLVSLVGSVGFSLLGLVVPVIMETIWYWSEEDDDDNQEQDCWDGTTVTTLEPSVTDAGTTSAVDGGPATTSAGAAGDGEHKPSSRGGGCRRAIRHLKNLILLLLGLLALVGGAFYNIRDIVARASGDGSPAPTI